MTLGLAIVFFAILMIYCGVKNKSLTQALLGHSVESTSSGSLLGSTSTGTNPPASAPTSAGSNAAGTTIIAPPTGG